MVAITGVFWKVPDSHNLDQVTLSVFKVFPCIMQIIQYTVHTTKFQCLFWYMFRPAWAIIRVTNCVKTQRFICMKLIKN